MHDLLTGAIAGNLAGRRNQLQEQVRMARLPAILRGVVALAAVAIVVAMIGLGETGGTEMAALATF
jgi:hypothetical protein